MTDAELLSFAPVPALLVAALHDVAVRRVPDWASALVVACGILARLASGDLLPSLLLASIVFALLFAFWQRGWLGGGDVKLLAACALVVPADAVVHLLLAVAVSGGLLAALYMLGRFLPLPASRAPAGFPSRLIRVELRRIRRRGPLPYACAIAAGCLFVLVKG